MSQKLFDRVVVSSDDSPAFLNFWPCVSQAWQKFFDTKPTLALVTNRSESDPLFAKLTKYGDVFTVPYIQGIPTPNQAKIARFLVASRMGDEVCMIEDIDTVPLQRKFFEDRLKVRQPDRILAVGHEVLANTVDAGKFPISNITTEGRNFQKLFNPNNLGHEDLLKSYVGMRVVDHKENIANDATRFSDESMIRGLINKHDLHHMVQKVERGANIHEDWIDRSWWGINKDKLNAGEYILCNFLRPCRENAQHFIPVYEYLYGFLPKASELFVL
jgi:hypothetical protein